MMIVTKPTFIVYSAEIVSYLHAFGWTDFHIERCRTPWGWKRKLYANGVPWSIARTIINFEADCQGIQFDQGQLGRVAHLLAAGYFVQEGDD